MKKLKLFKTRLTEDIRTASSPDALKPETPQDSAEELEESLQRDSIKAPLTVLSVSNVLRDRGTEQTKKLRKIRVHGYHPRSSRTRRWNIIFHPAGNKRSENIRI